MAQSANPRAPRILIVGAGPTGLSLALELARRGLMPDIVERRPDPSPFSRAVGIVPASLDLLEASGVSARIVRDAIRARELCLFAGRRRVGCLSLDVLEGAYESLFLLPQDRTETLLREAFEELGGRVRYGMHAEDVRPHADSVDVRLEGGTQSWDYVVGADGVRSTVRKAVGIEFPGHDLPGEWGIADVDWPGRVHPDAFEAYFLPKGEVLVVVPLAIDRVRIIASEPDAIAIYPRETGISCVRRAGSFTISIRQATAYRVGRVFLAGDAAHCHSPVGGRGMNLGIADAADLARRFAEGDLDGYHADRHAAGEKVIALSERARKVVMSRSVWPRLAFGLGLRAASVLPPLNRAVVRTILHAGSDP